MSLRIYLTDTGSVNEERFLWLYQHATAKRRTVIDRMRFQKDKLLSLAAEVLLSGAVKEYLTKGVNAWDSKDACLIAGTLIKRIDLKLVTEEFFAEEQVLQTEVGPYGKPYLVSVPGFHYNISHSGTKVLLACSDAEIGCDIEERPRNTESLVNRCFSDEEKRAYVKSEHRGELFTAVWTRKESFLKAIGLGLKEDLGRVTVLDENGNGKLEYNGISDLSRNLVTGYMDDGYCYSICYKSGEDFKVNHEISWYFPVGKEHSMDFDKITEYLETLPAEYDIPSYDCIIMDNHKQVYRHMDGTVDLEHKVPVSENNTYLMFSMTKIQTMTALMQLVEQGKVSLQDEVSKYLPAYGSLLVEVEENGKKTVVPAKTPLRIWHLASMQSGLDYDLERAGILRVKKEYGEQANTRQIVDSFAETPLHFEPGEHFLYSLSHDVVAAVIEVVSGMKFSEYLRKNIWEPLGMKNTHFFKKSVPEPNLAQQYICTNEGVVPMENDCCYQFTEAYESGGAGLVSCTEDYAILADTLACGGTSRDGVQILRPETIEIIRTNLLSEQGRKDIISTMGRVGYGYGCGMQIFMNPELVNSPAKAGVFGWDGAAGSCTIMDRDNNRALVFVIHVRNLGRSYSEIHPKLRDLLFL